MLNDALTKKYHRPTTIDTGIFKKLFKDFFAHTRNHVKFKVEGQSLNSLNEYVLGCMAGPSICLSNLCHEMAHFAEREVHKLCQMPAAGWGYTHGKYWEICGQSGYEPTTDQAVQREARCWAYQWSIINEYGIKQARHYREEEDDLTFLVGT
jgi:hypothetical protein